MKKSAIIWLCAMFLGPQAEAGEAQGGAALALATLVSESALSTNSPAKLALAQMFEGNSMPGPQIRVSAGSIVADRAGDGAKCTWSDQ